MQPKHTHRLTIRDDRTDKETYRLSFAINGWDIRTNPPEYQYWQGWDFYSMFMKDLGGDGADENNYINTVTSSISIDLPTYKYIIVVECWDSTTESTWYTISETYTDMSKDETIVITDNDIHNLLRATGSPIG